MNLRPVNSLPLGVRRLLAHAYFSRCFNLVASERVRRYGLAAALGTILLAVVLLFYWIYDKIVGIDNVKLGG